MAGATSTELLLLLDRLEETIASAAPFVGGRIIVSRDQLLDCIDAVRDHIPEAVVEAERITTERQRLLTEAREEAEETIRRAREQAAYLVQEHTLHKSAELEAERLLNRANQHATEVITSAERQAQEWFVRLEEEALRLAADIRKAAGLKS